MLEVGLRRALSRPASSRQSRQRRDDLPDDLILQGEDILEFAVVALGPKIVTACGVEKLDVHAQPVADLAHAPFGHISNVKLPAGLLGVDRLAPVGEAGMAGDHEQGPEPRQFGDDVLRDPVGKVILRGIAAQIRKRKHRDRRLVRPQWRRCPHTRFGSDRAQRPDVAVTAARQRLYPGGSPFDVGKHPAQSGDLDGQIAFLDGKPRPGRIHQCVLGYRRSRPLQKQPKQRDRAASERDRFGPAKEYLGVGGEAERTDFVDRRHLLETYIFGEICTFFRTDSGPPEKARSSCRSFEMSSDARSSRYGEGR